MKQDLGPLGQVDMLTNPELKEAIGHGVDCHVREALRGIKLIKFPVSYGSSDVNGNLLPLYVNGPASGYVWDIRRITVYGPAIYNSSGSPYVNVYRGNEALAQPDTNFITRITPFAAVTFPKLAVTLAPGEGLVFSGTGGADSSTWYVMGQVTEVPAEMIGKLV